MNGSSLSFFSLSYFSFTSRKGMKIRTVTPTQKYTVSKEANKDTIYI